MMQQTNNREGSQEIVFPLVKFQTCSGCKWFESQLVKSGHRPMYKRKCKHSKAINILTTHFIGNLNAQENELGLIITPQWCPVDNKNK